VNPALGSGSPELPRLLGELGKAVLRRVLGWGRGSSTSTLRQH
jgi:hypothetical protein